MALFHLAYHVLDLDIARRFYGGVLGAREGRSAAAWVDFDFYGHQLSLHLGEPFRTTDTGFVDGHAVPMPHLGVVLPLADWEALRDRLDAHEDTDYVFRPMLRYPGQPGEQWTLFIRDPFGNPIECKGFRDFRQVYAV